MKIKSKRKTYMLSMLLKSKRLKSLFLALFFVFLSVGLAGTSFYYGAVAQKHGITQRIKRFFKDDFPKYPYLFKYYAKGFIEEVPEIKINIKFKNFQKLSEMRKFSLEQNSGSRYFDYVNCDIHLDGIQIPCEIRLKGDRAVHYADDKEWSFRISTRDNQSIMGMRRFSLHKPRMRNYIYEWMYHELLRKEGLVALRYQFIKLNVNGEDLGLYALEEHFEKTLVEHNRNREGPILRFNEDYNLKNFNDIPIFPFKVKRWVTAEKKSILENAISKLEGFRNGKLNVSDAFDVDLMGKFFAITDLMNAHHATISKSMRFYYNPITSKLEPIGFDAHHGTHGQQLLSYEFTSQDLDESGWFFNSKDGPMYKLFFSNQELYLNYVGHLERISKAEYLDEFFAKYSAEINSYLSLIYADGSPYKDYITHFGPELFLFDKDKIYETQNHIKNSLKPNSHFDTIRAHVENNTDDFIALQISNIHSFPLVVEGVYINDTQITKNTSFTITPKVQSSPMKYESYQFPLAVDSEELANSDMNSMKIKFKVKGTGSDSLFSPVLPWKIWDSTYVPMTTLNDFYEVIRKLDFVSLNESKKEVFFRSGNWELNETLIIPQGFTVYLQDGLNLNLTNCSTLLSYSPVLANGNKASPIEFYSSDETGQGLCLLEVQGKSYLNFVNFSHMKSPAKKGWELTGAVTFYKSDVEINNCYFGQIQSEDALNIIRSRFSLENSVFEETVSDAYDSDFSNGRIMNCRFSNIGNDGIDGSGSVMQISNVIVKKCGDKAISGGEESKFVINSLLVDEANVAIASKDGSDILVSKVDINNCKYGFTVFRKKTEFNFAQLDLYLLRSRNVQNLFLVEEMSVARRDGVYLEANSKNLKTLLYP